MAKKSKSPIIVLSINPRLFSFERPLPLRVGYYMNEQPPAQHTLGAFVSSCSFSSSGGGKCFFAFGRCCCGCCSGFSTVRIVSVEMGTSAIATVGPSIFSAVFSAAVVSILLGADAGPTAAANLSVIGSFTVTGRIGSDCGASFGDGRFCRNRRPYIRQWCYGNEASCEDGKAYLNPALCIL